MTNIYDDGIGRVELVQHMGSDKTVVNAARVSFGKEVEELSDRDTKLIAYLMKHRHTSPFEHCTITWKFVVPLFVARQHHRHRTWAFNEISRRYTDENIQFYLPKQFRKQHESNRQASTDELTNPVMGPENVKYYTASYAVEEQAQNSYFLYKDLMREGVCREQARMILPQNMYTEYYGTVNLHNALHFIGLRLDSHAQYEIQLVAKAMLDDLEELYPVSVAAWKDCNER